MKLINMSIIKEYTYKGSMYMQLLSIINEYKDSMYMIQLCLYFIHNEYRKVHLVI